MTWRNAAIACPFLWTYLRTDWPTEQLQIYSSRSGVRPLEISGPASGTNVDLALFVPHWARVQTMRLQTDDFRPGLGQLLTAAMPVLQDLEFNIRASEAEDLDLLHGLESFLDANNLPLLHRLKLRIEWICLPTALPRLLAHLSLDSDGCVAGRSSPKISTLKMLRGLPLLETLDLASFFVDGQNYTVRSPVELPHLKILCLRKASEDSLGLCLNLLSMPPTTQITLEPFWWSERVPRRFIIPLSHAISNILTTRTSSSSSPCSDHLELRWQRSYSEDEDDPEKLDKFEAVLFQQTDSNKSARLTLKLDRSEMVGLKHRTHAELCSSLASGNLVTLRVSCEPAEQDYWDHWEEAPLQKIGWDTSDWNLLFSKSPGVSRVDLQHFDISAISQCLHKTNDDQHPSLPNLRFLHLAGLSFNAERAEQFKKMLASRAASNITLENLEIVSSQERRNAETFREYVEKLDVQFVGYDSEEDSGEEEGGGCNSEDDSAVDSD